MTESPEKKRKISHKIDYNALHLSSFVEQKHCDIKFECKDISGCPSIIGAHKMMLMSVSEVFETMFYGDAEGSSGVNNEIFVIQDITMETFKHFLGFIYGLDIQLKNAQNVSDFYYAAQKYACKDALLFVHEVAINSLCLNNCLVFYETASRHSDDTLKAACIQIFKVQINDLLSSSEFLKAAPETINSLFELDFPAVFSEIDFLWALERYIRHNDKTDSEIASKVRSALKQIRFLTLHENDIQATFLLTDEEKEALIKCLPDDANLSEMPEGFSVLCKKRQFRLYIVKADVQLFARMQEIHNRKTCSKCSFANNHTLWECSKVAGNKQQIKDIYEKYQHKDLTLYTHDDLEALYAAYKKTGLIN
ncbi:uncharacterized protein LOC134837157 [Culicoides brevitarsis]|uniref:uncharacterized protein LOC134837157 n=1 Tax=Culicoides brevitarsis TaxID=469753 RepID=UPI00307BC382